MSKVIIPKIKKTARKNYRSVSELRQFLQIIFENKPYKNYVLFRLLAYSSLRKGELYTLRWADFNPNTQLLTINKSLGRIKGHAVEKVRKILFLCAKSALMMRPTYTILHKWK